jgi:NAD-dependent SIR2 family protein deacetylase
MKLWSGQRQWRCAGCGSSVDVWAMPIGPRRHDVRLCRQCRRELVRRILHVETPNDWVISLPAVDNPSA